MSGFAVAMRTALLDQAVDAGNAAEAEYWLRRIAEGDVKPARPLPKPLRADSTWDTSVAFENFRALLEHHECRPYLSSNGQGSALCPAHDDRGASLRFKEEARLLINCRAGCTVDEVLAALHVSWSDLGGRR